MNIDKMNIVDKLREWQRGEREWDQADMVREVLAHFDRVRWTIGEIFPESRDTKEALHD
jgi:hypothetical protein